MMLVPLYRLQLDRQRCLALGADFSWDKAKDLAAIPAAFRALARERRGT